MIFGKQINLAGVHINFRDVFQTSRRVNELCRIAGTNIRMTVCGERARAMLRALPAANTPVSENARVERRVSSKS